MVLERRGSRLPHAVGDCFGSKHAMQLNTSAQCSRAPRFDVNGADRADLPA